MGSFIAIEGAREAGSSDEHLFTIGIMARDYNVSLRTLRFYEDRGLLHPLRRGSTRLYTSSDRQHLEMIIRGKQLGFTLTEISDLIATSKTRTKSTDLESTLQPEQIIAQITHLERQREEIDGAITALRIAHERLAEGWSVLQVEKGSPSATKCEA